MVHYAKPNLSTQKPTKRDNRDHLILQELFVKYVAKWATTQGIVIKNLTTPETIINILLLTLMPQVRVQIKSSQNHRKRSKK